jgi:hypothetical protein
MEEAGADWDVSMYGGASQGFTHTDAVPWAMPSVAFHTAAEQRSFALTRAFLAEAFAAVGGRAQPSPAAWSPWPDWAPRAPRPRLAPYLSAPRLPLRSAGSCLRSARPRPRPAPLSTWPHARAALVARTPSHPAVPCSLWLRAAGAWQPVVALPHAESHRPS